MNVDMFICAHTHTHTFIYIYIYIYICVCVCVYVCLHVYIAESLLHTLEQVAGSIGFYVNANKTKFMCFELKEAISILNGKLLKYVD